MIKVKDGYAKLIGTTYSGSADRVLLSNGGDKAVSDFAAASALGDYVTLATAQTITGVKTFNAGITVKGTSVYPLVVDSTNTSENGIRIQMSGVNKAWLGYTPGTGAYLYNYTGPHKIGINDSGVGFIDSNTILHSGNYTTYTVKKDGTGATGTWGINISGTAAHATSASALACGSFDTASQITTAYAQWANNSGCSDIPSMGYAAVLNVGYGNYRWWQIWNSRNDHQLYWRPEKSDASGWADVHILIDNKNIANYLPVVTNYYWANVKISDQSNSSTSPTFANATTTGLLTVSTGGSHCGIKAGSTYINSINSDLILQNNGAIRFGSDSWDYNCWAGLKYVHSSKTISLGLADGTHFTANSAQSGGTMQFPGIGTFRLNGTVHINPPSGSYVEGIRIHPSSAGWTALVFCGDDNTADSGTSAKTWGLFTNGGNFYINKNNSSITTGYELCNVSGNWGIGTTSPSEKLSVNGAIYTMQPSTNRRAGIIGTYDPNRAAAIWSMGSSYQIASDGTSFGSLYGAAYAYFGSGYTFTGYSGGHSFVWAQGGTPTAALGNNIWTSGVLETGSYLTFGYTGASFTSDIRSTWRQSLYGNTTNNSRFRTVRTDVTIDNFSEIYGSGITWATADTQGYLSVSYSSGKAFIGGGDSNKLNWSYQLLHSGNSSISDYAVKINGTSKNYVRDWGHGATDMNAVAMGGRSSMGMASLSTPSGGTATAVNPGGATDWHHFINIAYTDGGGGSNSWITQIANKAGTTDLWVRSRSGGTINNTSDWAAPWTRILTGSNYSSVVDGRYLRWGGTNANVAAMTWGTLTTSNGYTILSHASSSDGGDMGFCNKSGQIFMQLDGYYYQNEGQYRVTDVSETVTALGTNGNYLTWTKNGSTNSITVPYSTNADTVDNMHASQFVPKNYNNIAYSDLTAYYTGSTSPGYYRIVLPDSVLSMWNMLTIELSVNQDYSSGCAGKILIYCHNNASNTFPVFKASCLGTLTSGIKVYGSGGKYIYIGGCNAWGTISIDKILVGDSAIGKDQSNISIDTTASLPSTYQTASMSYNIDSSNIGSQSVNYATSAGTASNSNKLGGYAASDYVLKTDAKIYRWNSTIKGQTWSRLYTGSVDSVLHHSSMFSISGSIGCVVFSQTFLVVGNHSTNAKIIQLNGGSYTQCQMRALVQSNGTILIDMYWVGNDCSNSTSTNTMTISVNAFCFAGDITPTTSFTSDATIPSGYSDKCTISTRSNCMVLHEVYAYNSIYASHFYETSDANLKKNIKAILDSDNIPVIKEFDWKSDGTHSYGLIAQELEEQGYSELVSDSGSHKTVNYSAALSLIVGKLQNKIKELESEIENLKLRA